MHAPVPKAKAKAKTRRRLTAEIERHYWRVVLNRKDVNFIRAPWPTDADKAKKQDDKVSKGRRSRWPIGRRAGSYLCKGKWLCAPPGRMSLASDGIPRWDKPRFDLGVFYKIEAGRPHYVDYVVVEISSDPKDATKQLKALTKSTGATLPATWEGGNLDNPSAKVTKRALSYEGLIAAARTPLNLIAATVPGAPLYAGRVLAAAVMDTTVTLGRQRVKIFRPQKIKRKDGRVVIRHSLLVRHNGRLLRHTGFRCWFGARYPRRWNSAASSYLDIRIAGKATSRLDITWIQAAAAEQPLDYLDTRQTPNACVSGNKKISDLKSFSLDEAHSQAQEDAAALTAYLWDYRRLYNEAQKKPPILGFFLLWLAAGLRKEEEYGPHKPKARRLAPTIGSNIYWHRLDDGTRVAKLVTLNELLDEDIIKESRARDANLRRAGRTALLEPEEELELARRGKAGDIAARDKIIVHHRPLVERVGFETIPGPIWRDMRDDIVQVGMESLTKVWGDWDPEFGVRFESFAAGAIEWDMKDWLDQYYRQVPVDRSINVNIPMDNANDEDDDDDHKKEGAIDMTNAVYEAKRRLVAERMGCLDSRERRVIEGRLALNGGTKAVRLAALARELGVSESRVRQIEDEAAAKLQLAVL